MISEELAIKLEETGYNKVYTFNPINGETLGGNYVLVSELLDACGKSFGMLSLLDNGKWAAGENLDNNTHVTIDLETFGKTQKVSFGSGDTPEEAVAKLYLALKAKV